MRPKSQNSNKNVPTSPFQHAINVIQSGGSFRNNQNQTSSFIEMNTKTKKMQTTASTPQTNSSEVKNSSMLNKYKKSSAASRDEEMEEILSNLYSANNQYDRRLTHSQHYSNQINNSYDRAPNSSYVNPDQLYDRCEREQRRQRQKAKNIKRSYQSGPANSRQYVKYLDNTDNVFYEDSPQHKKIKILRALRPYVFVITFILLLLFFIVNSVKPYAKPCPPHATCLVQIRCHAGYELQNDYCKIDSKIISQAYAIGEAVVSQLTLENGDRECQTNYNSSESVTPSKSLPDIYDEFGISYQNQVFRNEILNYFDDEKNQQEKKFTKESRRIIPTSKQYSLSCKMQIFSKTRLFKGVLLLVFLLVILSIFVGLEFFKYHHALTIYKEIKTKLQKNIEMDVSRIKPDLEKKYGKWTEEIWTRVDSCRVKDQKIVFYEEAQTLYWRLTV